MDSSAMSFGATVILAAVVIAIYMIPTLIAAVRNHHQQLAISVANLLLGWMVLGWIAALVWSLTAVKGNKVSAKTHQKCPYCAEVVKKEAVICKHCGQQLKPEEAREIAQK